MVLMGKLRREAVNYFPEYHNSYVEESRFESSPTWLQISGKFSAWCCFPSLWRGSTHSNSPLELFFYKVGNGELKGTSGMGHFYHLFPLPKENKH